MEQFYTRLSYSFGNEDWETEQKALKIGPSDRVVCVTASGDRPLNLLTSECQEIVAIDANPMQNALFDLKRIAIKQLDYPQYLAFMGAASHPNRIDTYKKKIKPHLKPASAKLWTVHSAKVHHGVLYQGAIEQWLKRMSRILIRPIRGRKVDKLFSFTDLEEQRLFVKEKWDTYGWRKFFDLVLNPHISKYLIKDPGLYAHIDSKLHVGEYLCNRMNAYLNRNLAKDSVLMSLIFKGEVDENHYPPYLAKEGFEKLKPRIDRLRHETGDLISFLEQSPDSSFDRFSVSDVASYISDEDYQRLIAAIHRTAKPGARFCIRQFLSNHQIPSKYSLSFIREPELEKELENEDRCFVYHFMVGSIKK